MISEYKTEKNIKSNQNYNNIIKLDLQYSLMSKSNTFIAEQNSQ